MKLLMLYTLSAILATCAVKQNNQETKINNPSIKSVQPVNYDSFKRDVLIFKKKNKSVWGYISPAEKQKIFTTAVVQKIIPAWIGTKWDYNGTAQAPQQGYIACGYFVTTVLRDAGLNIARIKLGQCASEQMIVTIVQPRYVHRFSNLPLADFIKSIKTQGVGLYIVGLDNHTGFIYNDGDKVFFIHSTFIGTRHVQKENAAESAILRQSKYKVLGKISADEKVLNSWIVN